MPVVFGNILIKNVVLGTKKRLAGICVKATAARVISKILCPPKNLSCVR